MINTIILKIGIRLLKKAKFRKWARLEDEKYKWIQAVENSSFEFPSFLENFISTAFRFPIKLSNVYWEDTISAFYTIHDVNNVKKKIPLVHRKSPKKHKKDAYEYDGRLWYFYCNILASEYGWSERVIANLSVEDALSYIQEILTAQHNQKEFIWSASEIAYVYSKSSKTSKYVPLQKPYWMLPDKEEDNNKKVVAVPSALLPVGNGVNLNET